MIAPRIRPSGSDINILEDLGILHSQKVYERRIQAVSAPTAYNTARKAGWDKLAEAVKTSYEATVANAELITAGIPLVQRQELAINAAKMTYATQNTILEANFPSGSQAIALNAAARGKFPGMLEASSPEAPRTRRAPVRRKATKKK